MVIEGSGPGYMEDLRRVSSPTARVARSGTR